MLESGFGVPNLALEKRIQGHSGQAGHEHQPNKWITRVEMLRSWCKDVQLASMMERLDEEFRALVQKEDPGCMRSHCRDTPPCTCPSPRPSSSSCAHRPAGQQLSVKAAATVVSRVEASLDGHMTPQQVLAAGADVLRVARTRGAKVEASWPLPSLPAPMRPAEAVLETLGRMRVPLCCKSKESGHAGCRHAASCLVSGWPTYFSAR